MVLGLTGTAIGFAITVIYAIGGLVDAINKKETINWPIFLKTLIIGGVTAGFISMNTGDMLTQLAATTAVTFILDKLVNSLLRKGVEPTPPAIITPKP